MLLASSSRNLPGQTDPNQHASNPKFFGQRPDSLANKMSPNPLAHGSRHKRMESNQVFGNLFDHLEAEGKQMHIKQFKQSNRILVGSGLLNNKTANRDMVHVTSHAPSTLLGHLSSQASRRPNERSVPTRPGDLLTGSMISRVPSAGKPRIPSAGKQRIPSAGKQRVPSAGR